MGGYQDILIQLRQFTRKYYTRMLLKGLFLFLALGLLGVFGILSIEYFLWLNSIGRLLLLLVMLGLEAYLLFHYILIPLLYLFRLKKGLSNHQASVLIGIHFPEVADKLRNLLDLANDSRKSELLLASIEQRSASLNKISFSKAIDFRQTLTYGRYLVYPALLVLLLWVSGSFSDFFSSYKRVVNYDLAYQPPAPFVFNTIMGDLKVFENETFTVQVTTEGTVRPEGVSIVIDGREFLLQESNGRYSYTFKPPLQNTDFYFAANGVRSRDFELEVLKPPVIEDFTMYLNYPDYLNMPSQEIKSTGNAIFPEGTAVRWDIGGRNIGCIGIRAKDTIISFNKAGNIFSHKENIYRDYEYQLETSNEHVEKYEVMKYKFSVIKDAFPAIKISQVTDSLNPQFSYFIGEATDDHGLSKIEIVWYAEDEEHSKNSLELVRPQSNIEQFYYTFPTGLGLEEGRSYSFYFSVTDNDAIHNGKSIMSKVFSMDILDKPALDDKRLEYQQNVINQWDKTLTDIKQQKEDFEKINKLQHEKSELSFSDQTQLKKFLERQQEQDVLMEKFSKQLRENMEKEESDKEVDELLQERLERNELEAKKNAELLKELQKIADKIDKEELTKRLEELGKQQQRNERNLEQILELTKRYYVTEKAAQLSRKLERMSEDQKKLAVDNEKDLRNKDAQKKLNESFEQLSRELDTLGKDNKKLRKPFDIEAVTEKSPAVKTDQEEALKELEELNKNKGESPAQEAGAKSKAGEKQKSAGEKMKEMSEQLGSAGGGGGDSGITEDAEMLRQILDNLITFSFKQESLFEQLEKDGEETVKFSARVRDQQELRGLFEHIDDSLFSLSLRRAEISEIVNTQITEVYYNIDKALENMSEDRMYQAVSNQQYVFTAANTLADFLATLLDNMQQSLGMGSGSGSSEGGFQLPDIIKAQGELEGAMGKMGNKGKEGAEGQDGKDGNKGNNGSENAGDNGEGKGAQGKDGKGRGGDTGNSGDGKSEGNQDDGNSLSEEELSEIYEIYKQQQEIRMNLEKQLDDMINKEDRELGKRIVRMMEDFENDLLRSGITERTANKMRNIQHQLLKMENAAMEQGERKERESKFNKDDFTNPVTSKPGLLDNYKNDVEILNRQALPLQQIYQSKVKDYFNAND